MKLDPMTRTGTIAVALCLLLASCTSIPKPETSANEWDKWQLVVSEDGRRVDKASGDEWFYMADTAWSLFLKLDKEETDLYLKNRRDKGFSVIQAVAIMGYNTPWNTPNAEGHRPFIDGDPKKPDTRGKENYWTHVDWTLKKAKEYDLYVMLTPAWGSAFLQGRNVGKKELGTIEKCKSYATFIANRYKDYPNIIWMNGGDSSPQDADRELFITIGKTIKGICTKHLMGYHGHGFHNRRHFQFIEQDWNDFANYYSGHFTGDFSELNYKLVLRNWNQRPAKPIFDSEPAYEGLPKNVKFNPKTGYFEARDARRRAYWSVMAGAAGHAFGNNDVHLFTDKPLQGMRYLWKRGMDQPAAAQMGYLNKLMLSRSRKELVADATLVASTDPAGDANSLPEKYRHIQACRTNSTAWYYIYTGASFTARLGKIEGDSIKARWFNPRSGQYISIGSLPNKGLQHFDPPGVEAEGNDWVLELLSQ